MSSPPATPKRHRDSYIKILLPLLSMMLLAAVVAEDVVSSEPAAAHVARLEVFEEDNSRPAVALTPQYSFAYDVQDPHTGDSKAQFETRNGDVVQGSYSLIEADGTRRIVDYTADPVNGFNAVVSREPANLVVRAVVAAPPAAILGTAPAPPASRSDAGPASPRPTGVAGSDHPDNDAEVLDSSTSPLSLRSGQQRQRQQQQQQQQRRVKDYSSGTPVVGHFARSFHLLHPSQSQTIPAPPVNTLPADFAALNLVQIF